MLRQSRARCPLSYFLTKSRWFPPPHPPKPRYKWRISLSPRLLHFLLSGFCKLGFLCLLLVLETWGLCHANMTSFVRSTWAVGSISGALSNRSGRLVIKPVQAAAPLRVLYLSCFFFCCQGFHFYSLLILPNIPIGPNSEMVRSIWFLTEISGILGCVESAHNLMIWSDGK